MKEEIKEIYRDLYEEFGPGLFFGYKYYAGRLRPVRRIKEIIDKEIDRLDLFDCVRPDAKYFLLINMFEMVARPVKHPKYPNYIEDTSLMEYIASDVHAILSEISHDPRRFQMSKEISGHDILNKIAKLWDSLKVNQLEIWG